MNGVDAANFVATVDELPTAIEYLALDQFDPSTTQPRQTFDDGTLAETDACINEGIVIGP